MRAAELTNAHILETIGRIGTGMQATYIMNGDTRTTASLASRSTLPIHVTCSAIAVSANRAVLQIRHRALDRWLFPGGHVEPDDRSLVAAALRELTEETGLRPSDVTALSDEPFDVDIHPIPANPVRDEPAHQHCDLRYAFLVHSCDVELQTDEVSGHRWVPIDEVPPTIRDRLASLIPHS